ncbi:MAG: Stp1/IreP family PP2C-type Ser/Thr phosphatase [Ignavibacteria bacterium]|nr:Stp1/IreP family PP2C-type Ser/Thr phosphatase [Ignavibacteria bacterium]
MPEENSFSVKFGNKTDTGKVRQRNEDYLECFKSSFGDVFVVCDGMGGHEGGEIASRLAVSTIRNVITTNPHGISNTASIIEEAISIANKAIVEKSIEISGSKGMGTTCVILIVKNDKAFYGHVGDSRMYMIRAGKMHLMTRDHSFVQGLVDQGLLSWDEAENHPRKNEITQALGIFDKVNPEVTQSGLQLYKGDRFILCSDGLSGPVKESSIRELTLENDPVHASNLLIDAANRNGGPDNITVQIVEVTNAPALPSSRIDLTPEGSINREFAPGISGVHRQNPLRETREIPLKSKSRVPVIALIAGIIIIAGFAIYYQFGNRNSVVQLNTNDSTKVKDTSEIIDSNLIKIEKSETTFRDLYRGNETPETYSTPRIELDKNFIYVGSKNGESQNFSIKGLVLNIRKYDLRFKEMKDISKIDPTNYRFELVILYGKVLNRYEVILKFNPNGNLVLKSIKHIGTLEEKEIEVNNRSKDKNSTNRKEDIPPINKEKTGNNPGENKIEENTKKSDTENKEAGLEENKTVPKTPEPPQTEEK